MTSVRRAGLIAAILLLGMQSPGSPRAVGFTCAPPAVPSSGKEGVTMDAGLSTAARPPVDLRAPAATRTATFALG